jgi:hypothetical protein
MFSLTGKLLSLVIFLRLILVSDELNISSLDMARGWTAVSEISKVYRGVL